MILILYLTSYCRYDHDHDHDHDHDNDHDHDHDYGFNHVILSRKASNTMDRIMTRRMITIHDHDYNPKHGHD